MTKRNFEYNVDTVGGTMNRYEVAHIKDGSEIYYYIRCSEDMSIVAAPSKYLKHKTKSCPAHSLYGLFSLSAGRKAYG